MDADQQRKTVEALILAAPEPISAARLAEIVPNLKPAKVRERVAELNAAYETTERAFEIWEVAGGYQMRTRQDYAAWVKQLHKERPLRMSRAALETLSVIAYKQPVTRAEIENIRGVDAGAVVRSLLDRKLVRIAGHREVPGRPMLYATTRRFLEVFGLTRLEDLPTLREIDELVLPGDDPDDDAEPTTADVAPDDDAENEAATPGDAEAAIAELASDEDAARARHELH